MGSGYKSPQSVTDFAPNGMLDGLSKVLVNLWCTWKSSLLGTIEILLLLISSEYFFLSNARFLSFRETFFPDLEYLDQKCIVVPSMLMAATPVGSSYKTRTLFRVSTMIQIQFCHRMINSFNQMGFSTTSTTCDK